jgi:hypothetical protein
MGMMIRRHESIRKELLESLEASSNVASEGMVENPEVEETKIYTSSELSEMKAGEIKKLGAELGYKITAVKQTDCMKQFLEQQNK